MGSMTGAVGSGVEGSLGTEALGITSGGDRESRCRVRPYPEDADQGWRCGPDEPRQLGLQVLDFLTELTVSAGKRAEGVPGRHRGVVQATGTEAGTSRGQSSGGKTIERFAELGRGRDYQSLHLVGGLGASLDGRVLGALQHADHLDFALA